MTVVLTIIIVCVLLYIVNTYIPMPESFKKIHIDNPESRMRKYPPEEQQDIDWSKFPFTKFMIVVPTETDKRELQDAFEYLHFLQDVDTDYITVNQLVHQYLGEEDSTQQIIVDPELFKLYELKLS